MSKVHLGYQRRSLHSLSGFLGRSFKSAIGDIDQEFGEKKIIAAGEDGLLRTLEVKRALVLNPLVSAAAARRNRQLSDCRQ